jgi:hypothetical protein
MKKFFFCLLSLMLFIIASGNLLNAQGTTDVRQVIIANGGKFEGGPPYSDYASVESYNLATSLVTIFDTIYTQSVQDVLIHDNHAYVTAQDSIVMYNIDNYQRIAAVKDSGVNKMALYNNELIVTKQYPVGRFHVEVLDATNLGLLGFVDGIPGDCEGVTTYFNRAFVACDSGFSGTQGRIVIINMTNLTIDTIVNLGTPAIGIYSMYAYNGFIYCVNKTPYGGSSSGSITQFNPSNGSFTTYPLAFTVGFGIGIKDSLLYLGINKSIGAFNLNTQILQDTAIISFFGSGGSLAINSAALDYVNNRFFTNIGNRTSFGVGVVFSLAGDSLSSYSTGLNADACAIDFRNPTGIVNTGKVQEAITVYPNPAVDFISINQTSTSTLQEIKILDLTGRIIESRPVQKGENTIRVNVSDYSPGVYLISLTTDQGTKVRKFIRR